MKYFVLGYFGYKTNQLDGQTVKTRDLYRLLEKYIGIGKVDYFDTQNFQYDKTSVWVLLKKLVCSKYVFYLPAHNNLKYIFPIIFVLSKIFRFEILYFVVGGWLVEYLSAKPMHRWMLKRIKGIFTETRLMKESLESKYAFDNIVKFPNFRFTAFVPTEHHEDGKLKIVFLARINKMTESGLVYWGNHTDDHVMSDNCTDVELAKEIKICQEKMREWTGQDCNFIYSYPNGNIDDLSEKIIKKLGFQMATTTEQDRIHPDTDIFRIPRMEFKDVSLTENILHIYGIWTPFFNRIKQMLGIKNKK